MSLSPFDSYQSRFVTYLLNFPRMLYDIRYDMIYSSTAIGLTPGGSGTVQIYTQTIHRTTQITAEQHK